MSEHTKTPWCTDELEHDTPYEPINILGENGRLVCRFWIDDAPVHDYNAEQRANARHIVRCVNNHEKMIEALEECRDAMEAFNRAPGATRDEWEFECEVKEIDTLLAALEAGKGGN